MKQLYLILLILLYLPVFGQNNVDLYKIEKEGDKLIQAGRFTEAITIYEKYKIINFNKPISYIDTKIKNATLFISLYDEAIKDYNSKRFINSLSKLRRYRDLFPGLAIKIIDVKIENAISQIERTKNFAQLEESEKIIFGFEKNYLGEIALENGDLKLARELYQSAIVSTKNVKKRNSVGSQANRRIAQINSATNLINQANTSNSADEKIRLLESYKDNGGLIIKSIEKSIDSIALVKDFRRLSSTQPPSLEARLKDLASSCDFNKLLVFVSDLRSPLPMAVSKDTLYRQLFEFNQDLKEIRSIQLTKDNGQRDRFVFGGYENLIESSARVALVGNNLTLCITNEYFNLLISYARPLFETEKNLSVARDIAIKAKGYSTTREQADEISNLITMINGRLGCENVILNVNSVLTIVDVNLSNCLLSLAKSNFDKALKSSDGCKSTALSARLRDTEDRISNLEVKLQRAKYLKEEISNRLAKLRCSEIKDLLSELDEITICSKNDNQNFIAAANKQLIDCERVTNFNKYLTDATKGLDMLGAPPKDLVEYGLKIQEVARSTDQAAKIANGDIETREIINLKRRILKANTDLDRKKFELRTDKVRRYSRLVKPELYLSAMTVSPKITSQNNEIQTVATNSGNYEIGLNLRLLKRGNTLNSAIGVHYATNYIEIKNLKGVVAERVQAEYLTGEYKITTGFKENSHPYVGLSFGVKHPIKVRYTDEILKTNIENTYFSSNKFVNTQLFTGFSVGYEAHRKNLGFSMEGFLRLSGFLQDDKTKESLLPVLKSENFNYYKNDPQAYASSVINWGFAVTFHFW